MKNEPQEMTTPLSVEMLRELRTSLEALTKLKELDMRDLSMHRPTEAEEKRSAAREDATAAVARAIHYLCTPEPKRDERRLTATQPNMDPTENVAGKPGCLDAFVRLLRLPWLFVFGVRCQLCKRLHPRKEYGLVQTSLIGGLVTCKQCAIDNAHVGSGSSTCWTSATPTAADKMWMDRLNQRHREV